MASRRSKNKLMGLVMLLGAAAVGAWQSDKIKGMLDKVTGKAS